MKALITGGAGFIGSHLARLLIEKGHQVTVLDNLMRPKNIYLPETVRFVKGDVRSVEDVDEAIYEADVVFHMAACNIQYSVAYPTEAFDININGTFNVVDSADRHGCKVVFSSSASVYGQAKHFPTEETEPFRPITPYCISKIAGEYILKMKRFEDVPWVALRYFNVYGLKQQVDAYYTSVAVTFIEQALRNDPLLITGDGFQSMDFINVRDIAEANLRAALSPVSGEAINIGSGIETCIIDLAAKIVRLTHSRSEIKTLGASNPSIVQHRRASIEKAERLLGFRPSVSLDPGLEELVSDMGYAKDYIRAD